MMRKLIGAGLLGYGLCVGAMVGATPVVAQSVSQTTEDAGHPTTNIAQDAGKGSSGARRGCITRRRTGRRRCITRRNGERRRFTAYVEHHVKPNM